jgi:hypothetical protein
MPSKVLPLKEWLPDQPDLGNYVATATNVIPWAQGYKSFPSFSTVSSNALTARFQGGTFAQDTSANTYIVAGDATKLYKVEGTTFSDVTRITISGSSTASGSISATAYSTNADDWWEFIVFGSQIIGVNGHTDAPQEYTIGTSTKFNDLAGSPPKARHIAIVRDFVVMGNLNETGTITPHRVRWSAINNAASWTVSAATQADYQDLDADGGWVQRIIGGEYGVVVQQRALTRMTYVGSPVIFQFDKIENNRGTIASQSVVGYGGRIWFIADDGFYESIGGGPARAIGDGKVDNFFLTDAKSAAYPQISAAVDPLRKLVMWAYPGAGANGTIPNHVLIYNWVYKKWGYAEIEIEGFVNYAGVGYTLEQLDAISASLDALTPSLDDRSWKGGGRALAGYNTSHKLGTFGGTPLDATVDTGEYQLTPGRTSHVRFARPLVDANAASVAVGARSRMESTHSFGNAVPVNLDGLCFVRSHARYHRFRIQTTGTFDFIQGIEVEFEKGGKRTDGSATIWDSSGQNPTYWDVS